MFCKNCGKPIQEGMTFCSTCGTRVHQGEHEAPAVQTQQNESVNDAVDVNTLINDATVSFDVVAEAEKPVKKKKGKRAILISVIALLVVLSMVVTVFASPSAKNTFMKMVLSSDDYFAYVIKENVEDYIESTSKSIDEAKHYMKDGSTSTGSISVQKGAGLEAILEAFVDEEELEEVMPVIDMFKQLAFSYKVTSSQDAMSMDLGVRGNDVDFGSIKYIMDMKNHTACFALPDYNKGYVGVDMEEELGDSYYESNAAINKVVDLIPDEKTSKRIAERYITCALKNLTGVEESKETITADEVSQKVTKLSLDIDGQLMLNVAKAVLTELKDDEDVKGIVDDIADMMGEDINYKKEIEELLEELKEVDAEEIDEEMEVEVSLDLYVDGKGNIVGVGVNAGPAEFEMYGTEKGKKFGEAIKFSAGPSSVGIEGGGKESKGKRAGEYKIKAMGMTVADISINDIDVKLLEKGLFSGSVTIKPSKSLKSLAGMAEDSIPSEIFDVSLVIDSASESQEKSSGSIALCYKDDLIVKIGMSAEMKKVEEIKAVSDYVNMENEEEFIKWMMDFDISKLAENLRKFGIDNAIIDEMEEGFKSSVEETKLYLEYGDGYNYEGQNDIPPIGDEFEEPIGEASEEVPEMMADAA